MALRAVISEVEDEKPPELYFHRRLDAYECQGCAEMIEVSHAAALMIEGVMERVRVRGNPEHLLLWLELHTLDQAGCHKFKDAAAAKAFRQYRKRTMRRARR